MNIWGHNRPHICFFHFFYIYLQKKCMTATELFIYFFNHCSLDTRSYLNKVLRKLCMNKNKYKCWLYPDFSNRHSFDDFLCVYHFNVYYLFEMFPFVKSVRHKSKTAENEWKKFLRLNVKKNIYKCFGINNDGKFIYLTFNL